MPGTSLPKGERRRRRHAAKTKAIHRLSLILVCVATVLIAVAIYFWVSPMLRHEVVSVRNFLPTQEFGERVASKYPSPDEKDAIGLVKDALATREADQVSLCFHSGSASPREVVEFLGKLPALDGPVDRLEWLSSVDANDLQIDGVLIHSTKEGKLRQRFAFLTPGENGVWKIDFDSFARTVRPSWQEVIENRAPQAVVRVFLMTDSYYNGVFRNDKEWECYGMASPDHEELLLGYCKVGSPQAATLKWIFQQGQNLNRAVLEIKRPADSASKQFEITRVLAHDWVLGPKPFDESFK